MTAAPFDTPTSGVVRWQGLASQASAIVWSGRREQALEVGIKLLSAGSACDAIDSYARCPVYLVRPIDPNDGDLNPFSPASPAVINYSLNPERP